VWALRKRVQLSCRTEVASSFRTRQLRLYSEGPENRCAVSFLIELHPDSGGQGLPKQGGPSRKAARPCSKSHRSFKRVWRRLLAVRVHCIWTERSKGFFWTSKGSLPNKRRAEKGGISSLYRSTESKCFSNLVIVVQSASEWPGLRYSFQTKYSQLSVELKCNLDF
jgi:hypothetical protein